MGLTAAVAQPGGHGENVPDRQASAKDQQARRIALRHALQAQRSAGNDAHTDARGEREFSVQERHALRQQLRQQRHALSQQ